MDNPVLVEVTRGGEVESRHRGAFAVADAQGRLLSAVGDADHAVFPRSAIKIFQALPLVESGAADAFGFTQGELALACASHGGEPRHVETAASMLRKAGFVAGDLECGAHWPFFDEAAHDLAASGAEPSALHNNCSGKHAGMLALARHLGVQAAGYVERDHQVQRTIAATMGEICETDLATAPCGVDGCSVPTWSMPLANLARGLARLASPDGLAQGRAEAAARLFAACAAEPFLVAGTGRMCTRIMSAVPRAFVKVGAEGVYCAAVPHAGLGIALKCDDGASRAAEAMVAAILARLSVFSDDERGRLAAFECQPVLNRRGTHVGDVRAVAERFEAVKGIAA